MRWNPRGSGRGWRIGPRFAGTYLGDDGLLRRRMPRVVCSGKYLGNLILDAYDLWKGLRKAGRVVVSGFHSAIEKDTFAASPAQLAA